MAKKGEHKIALDTSVFIYLFEEHPLYGKLAERLIRKIEMGTFEAVFSCIGLIELQTGPKKMGRFDLSASYRELLGSLPNLSICGLDEESIEIASDLRARYDIATPDAIHIATAIHEGADAFVANDRALKKIKEISIHGL